MERSLLFGQRDWQQVGEARVRPASIAKRSAAPEKQQSPAAAVHELLDQFFLRRREVVRLDRTDDDRLVGKQFLGGRGKAVGEFLRIIDSLPVNFIFARPQHRNDRDDAVVFLRTADEFIFPARLAFDIQDAALRWIRR